MHLFSDIARAL